MNFFGTDGIRSKVGNFPLTKNEIYILGQSIAHFFQTKYKQAKILIAHDTRQSSYWIKSILKSAFLQFDVKIFDGQILPTPVCYNLVYKQKLFDYAIVITASHNQFQDNGIKIVDSLNCKLDTQQEQQISSNFTLNNFGNFNYQNFGSDEFYQLALTNYITDLIKYFKKDFLKETIIAIDCANGANYKIAKEVFNYFGANVISFFDQPNGKNINLNCGSTNANALSKLILDCNADIGFAFDGDGDRITIVSKYGQIKDGDDILALLSQHPIYNQNKVISTIVSNCALEHFLKNKNKILVKTPVGDKNIAKELQKQNLLLAAEPSGHVILNDYLNSSDGIFAALRLLEVVKLTENWQLTTFEKYAQYCINLPIIEKKDLNSNPIRKIITKFENKINGKIIIRYSGTEPVLRIVVEAKENDFAKKIALELVHQLNPYLQSNIKENVDEKAL